MARYLLDADALIDYFIGVSTTIELIADLYRQGDALCTCDVVIAELFSGLLPVERTRGQQLLASLQFLLTTSSAARQAGIWRYEFARRGRRLPTTDCLIAAIAVERQATVITGNVSHYLMEEVNLLTLPRRK